MKILILANDDEGLYQFRKELLVELMKDNIVFATVPEGPYKQDLIDLGIKLTLISVNRHGINPLDDFRLICQYAVLIHKICPDVVLTYTIKPNVYGGMVCRLYKVPYIANITGLGIAVENTGIIQQIALILYKIGLKGAKKIFFQNSENQKFMKDRKVVDTKIELLPGSGVNLKHFIPLEYPTGVLIQFAFISRIMKEKGIEQYLEAAAYIRKKYPNTRFHVCGYCEQDYNKKLKELNDNDTIIYHGCIRDVREIHKISSCTIHPTYYPEGLSNVLLESLSCCRPIITTERSGCREVIDDGINGFIVHQQDSKDLIKVIEKFIALPIEKKKQMGLDGRKKVEKEFDRRIIVERYLATIYS